MKRTFLTLMKMGIVAAILYYLIQSGRLNFERLLLLMESPGILLMMYLILIVAVVPMATFRWWLLLRAIGLNVEPKRTFLLTWIGNFFNTTLPGAITGDVVKGYYVIRSEREEGRTRAFMTLLIDRFVGLFGLVVMAFIALIFNLEMIWNQSSLHPLAWSITALFGATLIFYGIALYPFAEGRDPFIRLFSRLPGKEFLLKVYLAFKSYQHRKPTLVITLLLSITIHTLIGLIFYEVSKMMGIQEMGLATQFFLMPVGLITIAIPIAPGGIGIGHAAFESLYLLAGFAGGADIFNVFVIVQLSVFLLGGIPYFLYSGNYKIPEKVSLTKVNGN
ncbi:MAG: lysylphosphatidylglycerol synthase transmembrane domain-containing protein [SAR324 cluster bacterium]|nr:lysylphosphatidylglycerol synthase transmembrane domain-containing protein [SAR324 cluster bacterium]|tara:strand:- start:258 stop:1256 length:999 start_codon:yes stop_codon:yes gene_type:complete